MKMEEELNNMKKTVEKIEKEKNEIKTKYDEVTSELHDVKTEALTVKRECAKQMTQSVKQAKEIDSLKAESVKQAKEMDNLKTQLQILVEKLRFSETSVATASSITAEVTASAENAASQSLLTAPAAEQSSTPSHFPLSQLTQV